MRRNGGRATLFTELGRRGTHPYSTLYFIHSTCTSSLRATDYLRRSIMSSDYEFSDDDGDFYEDDEDNMDTQEDGQRALSHLF